MEVTKDVCNEINKRIDERFERNKDDIGSLQDKSEKISELTIQMGEILKKHDERLDDHGRRITTLEHRPAKLWDALIGALVGALAASVAGGIFTAIFK